jgi:hypothetical protein
MFSINVYNIIKLFLKLNHLAFIHREEKLPGEDDVNLT